MTDPSAVTRGVWSSGVQGVLKWQAACGLLAAGIVGLWLGMLHGIGVAFGVALALINGFWLAKRIARASALDKISGQRVLYTSAALRFVGLLIGLALAIVLGLHLLAVAGGLFLSQLAAFVYAVNEARCDQKES